MADSQTTDSERLAAILAALTGPISDTLDLHTELLMRQNEALNVESDGTLAAVLAAMLHEMVTNNDRLAHIANAIDRLEQASRTTGRSSH